MKWGSSLSTSTLAPTSVYRLLTDNHVLVILDSEKMRIYWTLSAVPLKTPSQKKPTSMASNGRSKAGGTSSSVNVEKVFWRGNLRRWHVLGGDEGSKLDWKHAACRVDPDRGNTAWGRGRRTYWLCRLSKAVLLRLERAGTWRKSSLKDVTSSAGSSPNPQICLRLFNHAMYTARLGVLRREAMQDKSPPGCRNRRVRYYKNPNIVKKGNHYDERASLKLSSLISFNSPIFPNHPAHSTPVQIHG
ncbi:hypothetical protein BU15DRAFT_67944 [Melanogaster broomeanus]|nr:hypothetical protein BU15DRAFT_67944 [Melanogaster broomeanus]